MVDPIGELLKISPKPPIDREPRPNTYSVADLAASLEQDQVSVNTDSLREAIQAEVAGLKNELPSLVKQALLAPAEDAAARQEPLTTLLFRLQNPLESILGQTEDVPEDLFVGIQEELENFKLVFPDLKNSDVLLPLLGDEGAGNRLDGIIGGLTAQVDGLIGSLRTI